MSANEIFDIFDEHMNRIGTAPRHEVHAKGLWHQTFHCWIVSEIEGERSLLFQLRDSSKDTFPNVLDISCAGHLTAGEGPADGVRELAEELGLHRAFEELASCGVYVQRHVITETLIDREFCHTYMIRCDQPLNEYDYQRDEITGLFRVPLSDLWKLLTGEAETIAISGIISKGNGIEASSRVVSKADFVPHPIDYYKMIRPFSERL